jgi:pimeloyl-ACP methyl ester carboxylesterase
MYHIYSVGGFGCWIVDPEKKKKEGNIVYFNKCNSSFIGMVTNILDVCWKHKHPNLVYARKIARQVKKSIEDPNVEKVYMVGHSFGGFVCSITAQILNDHPRAHKLDIITYGSIMVIDPGTCPRVSLGQYMYKGDVSMRCIQNKEHVKWIKSPIHINNIIDSLRSHLSYPVRNDRSYLIKKYSDL